MKTSKWTVLGLATLSVLGCAQESSQSSVTCDDRLCSMSQSIYIDQSGVSGAQSSSTGEVTSQGLFDNVLSLTPTLTLINTIATPTVNGTGVQASDVTVSGTKVYVAYNTAGEVQAGAIDVIDFATPTAATLVSEALYPTTDIHKIFVTGSKLYAAGATSDSGGGGNLQRINLDASGKLTSTVSSVFLRSAADPGVPAYAGTSVVAAGNYIYAVSGNNGGLSILNNDATMTTSGFTAIPDARDITFGSSANSNLYVVTGKTNSTNAETKPYSLTGTLAAGSVTLNGAVANDQAKSTVSSGSTLQLATAGFGGAKLICKADGNVLGTTVNPVLSGLTASQETANAAAFGAGYMFVANGEAGVTIYSVNVPLIQIGCTAITITYLGRFTVEAGASVNNIYYSNGYLVIATGTKGFKVVKVVTSVLSGLLQAL